MFYVWFVKVLAYCKRYWLWVALPLTGVVFYMLGRRKPVVLPPPQEAESRRVDDALGRQEQAAKDVAAEKHEAAVRSLEDLVTESIEQLREEQRDVAGKPPTPNELNDYLVSVGKRVR
jgi:hypothetical protein